MFNQAAIKALATQLNGRWYSAQLNALGALSNLILRKRHGSNVVYATELGALLHSKLENAFPLPHMNLVVDGINNTVTLDKHVFKLPEENDSVQLTWRHPASPWSVVVKDEKGGYQMIASGDRYGIPHGEIGVPFDVDAHMSLTGSLRAGNLLLNGSHAIWFIETWQDFGMVLAGNDFDIPQTSVQRIYNQAISCSPLELDNEEALRTTYLNQDLTDRLKLEQQPYPYSVMDLVERLLETTNEVEDLRRRVPVNTDTEANKVVLDVALKIQNSIHFNDLLTEVMELPAKKRTKRSLNEIIPRHLKRVIEEWATKK